MFPLIDTWKIIWRNEGELENKESNENTIKGSDAIHHLQLSLLLWHWNSKLENGFKKFKHTVSTEIDKVDTGDQYYINSISAINASRLFKENNNHNSSRWRQKPRQTTSNPQTKTNSITSATNNNINSRRRQRQQRQQNEKRQDWRMYQWKQKWR